MLIRVPTAQDEASPGRIPTREVICGDGLEWLRQSSLGPHDAIITSLPDVSELSFEGGGEDLASWQTWFVDAAFAACSAAHPSAPVIFFQTDIKREGRLQNKAFLVQLAAQRAGLHCLFHKVVCRVAPASITFGRPAFSHLLCFSRELRFDVAQSTADVLPDAGHMPWSRAMGVTACEHTCRFLARSSSTLRVVDPFCGLGTVLAVANQHGFDALGVELSKKRARKARNLVLPTSEPTLA